jgi:hypothetical protein
VSYRATSETADVPATAEQPYDQDDDENNAKYPADAIRTPAGVIATSIISKSATKEDDQQNNYEDQLHDKLSSALCQFRLA